MKKFKLTPKILNKIIAEETARLKKLGLLKSTKSQNKVDYIEKLSIQENNLKRQLKIIHAIKKKLKNSQ